MNEKMKVWNITYKHPKTGEVVRATTYAENEASARKRAMELNVPTQNGSFYWKIVSIEEDVSFASPVNDAHVSGKKSEQSILISVLFRGFHENDGCTIRNRYMVRTDTICEATRDLSDLNGKRIFEGDLCYIPREDGRGNMLMQVCFYNGEPSVSVVGVEPQNIWTFRLSRLVDKIDIIGNVFENPELVAVVSDNSSR